MPDRLVLGVFLCDNQPQVSLTRENENGIGGGYRLLGPSFIGTSELLSRKVLTEGDATEVRRLLDAVFPQAPGLEARIAKALELASDYGTIDGDHHKTWVIDQIVRALTGCPVVTKDAVDYQGTPYSYEAQGESPEYAAFIGDEEWDEGIAP